MANIASKLSVNLGEEKETEVKLKQMLASDSCSFNTNSIDFIDALSMVVQQLWRTLFLDG